ncbi:hypothetical protein HYT24_01820, partial [Candidatus Pacearchaeota archaeon]|nr:hypothetical protein [Candidatus Pacearchaeota archaeon]
MEKSSRWHYEGIRSQRQDEAKRTLREFQARFRIRGPQAGLVNQLTNEATSRKDDTNKSHPILLGPATVDSLLDEVPERLDYVKESKLPFDDMFFEFMEP